MFLTKFLPVNDIRKCLKGDYKCVASVITDFTQEHSDGYEEWNVKGFNPLEVEKIDINSKSSSSVNVHLQILNAKIYGFKGLHNTRVKGFGEDIRGPHVIYTDADILSLLGDYTVSGKVLILPIRGAGKCNVTYIQPKYEVKFKGEPVNIDGRTHLKIVDFKLNMKINKFFVNLENLFNDAKISKEMNVFFNENWEDIFKELKDPICRGIEGHVRDVYSAVFKTVPYDELFLEK